MENQFIPYEQALELKALGFNEECIASYTETLRFDVLEQNGIMWHTVTNEKLKEYEKACTAPLYQQAFRWFRDKKLSDACICRYQSRDDGGVYYYYVINHDFGIEETRHFKEGFLSYEEAELACLKKLIEIVKNK